MTQDAPAAFPPTGVPADQLLARIDEQRAGDLDWRGGRAFSLVYNPGDDAHDRLLEAVHGRYVHENALNPFKYPSLMQMELDLVSIGGDLLGTGPDCGAVTSGGTESIFCAVLVARDQARNVRGIDQPELLTAETAHPAFAKAAKYLGLDHVRVPVGDDGRADVAAMTAAVTGRTALVVGSAPCYPFGVIDPIGALAAAAVQREVLFHTDACLGGWILPWWAELGEPVEPWDLRVDGVTSVSADIHKYGYAAKGASMVMYADRSLLRNQHFWYDDWPGGLYASGTPAGTRPAAPIAGAWAAIHHLGRDGYLRLTADVLEATRAFRAGIDAIDGVAVAPTPDVSVFQLTATEGTDIGAVGDAMDDRGWNLDRQQGGLHVMLSPYHRRITDRFLADLAEGVAVGGVGRGQAATYGGIV